MEMLNPSEQDNSNKPRKRKNSREENVVSEVFNDYCSSTSIHGMGYLGAEDKSLAEKIWWVIVIIISVICCSYLISKTWNKWKTSPVILSFEQEQTPIWKIPFPAVTICPLNKVQQTEYNYTEMFHTRNDLKGEDHKKFWDVSLSCGLNEFINKNEYGSINFTDKEVYKNIRSAAPLLEDTIGADSIKWLGKKQMRPEDLFKEQITEEGVCFTFNSFSQYDMYTNELNHEIVFINQTEKHARWSLEDGYRSDSSYLNIYPRRTARDGEKSGLTVVLLYSLVNAEYICGQALEGFKIILHNPAETPRPAQQYYLIPLDRKVTFRVKPETTSTSENLRSMSVADRKCYFSNEKSLRFFNVYTQGNCRTECNVNVTQHMCGCVPFYMPHDKNTPICGYGRIDCTEEAEVKMLEFEMIEEKNSTIKKTEMFKIFDRCDCLPSCSDVQYSAETSETKTHFMRSLLVTNSSLLKAAGHEELSLMPTEYVARHISFTQIDIFFKESQFLALHRSELYGVTDFLSNIGGLLGLFMGFSVLSLIEIFYFSTIRTWIMCRNRERRRL